MSLAGYCPLAEENSLTVLSSYMPVSLGSALKFAGNFGCEKWEHLNIVDLQGNLMLVDSNYFLVFEH